MRYVHAVVPLTAIPSAPAVTAMIASPTLSVSRHALPAQRKARTQDVTRYSMSDAPAHTSANGDRAKATSAPNAAARLATYRIRPKRRIPEAAKNASAVRRIDVSADTPRRIGTDASA